MVWSMFWGFVWLGGLEAAGFGKLGKLRGKEKPCWALGRAGFSKISMIYDEIANYLLRALLGCVSLLAYDGTIPRSQCIPVQRNPRAAFAKFELVRMEVIGDEGMFCLVPRLKLVKGNFAN